MAHSLHSSILLLTTNPRHDKDRIETIKGGLKDVYSWILDDADFKRWRYQQQSQLLWIKGDPGKSKTMLMCGFIDELTNSAPDTPTVSFFFCQATDIRINHANAVLRGLIFMLVDQQPSLISHVRRQYDKTGKKLFEDVNAWQALSKIFDNILNDPLLRSTYLVVDAIDECTADSDRLLDLLIWTSSAYSHVKWVVSSHSWPAIEDTLNTAIQKTKFLLDFNDMTTLELISRESCEDAVIWGKLVARKRNTLNNSRPLFGGPPSAQSTRDWLIDPQDKTKFDSYFEKLDTAKAGVITGDQAVPFFDNAQLPDEVMAQIWDLADINGDGQLNREEFAVAMYLVRLERSGKEPLPQELPPTLIPPNMRRQDPSATSKPQKGGQQGGGAPR
ncbi:unnamed protein product [Penicillium pancosmium]